MSNRYERLRVFQGLKVNKLLKQEEHTQQNGTLDLIWRGKFGKKRELSLSPSIKKVSEFKT